MEPHLLIWSIEEPPREPLLKELATVASSALGTENVTVVHKGGGEPELAGKTAALIVLDHTDAHSLKRAQLAVAKLPLSAFPYGILILRAAGKSGFKMTCPHCEQKLWIRDTDVEKRGKCPSCARAFEISAQKILVRNQLRLPVQVEVAITYEDKLSDSEDFLRALLDPLVSQAPQASGAFNETTFIEIEDAL